jgi:carboxyl-terminal processing protease
VNAVRIALIALACALLALLGGVWLGGHPESLPEPVRDALVDDDQAVRAELVDMIEDNFIRDVDPDELEQRSFKALVRGLGDRFSNYLTPREAAQFERGLSGKFEGVGLTVEEDPRGLEVLSVIEGSPAERAGIHRGELITAVDGRSIAGVDSNVSTARIKGTPGTEVRLTVVTPGSGRTRELEVERAEIDLPVARSRIVERDGRKLGEVRLFTFAQDGTHGQLRQHVERLLGRGAQGILLDLRGNGGGLLQEGVLVSSTFIEDGLIVSTKGRARAERKYDAEGDAIDEKIPVVVLVDRGSASASEIVTGALRDRKRATVVGDRTFGKGVFQEVENLPNGGSLDLTVGSYYLPSGENISGRGIRPQVRAKDDPKTERDEALPVAERTLVDKLR